MMGALYSSPAPGLVQTRDVSLCDGLFTPGSRTILYDSLIHTSLERIALRQGVVLYDSLLCTDHLPEPLHHFYGVLHAAVNGSPV